MANTVGCAVRVVDSYCGVALPYTRIAMLMFPSSPHQCAGVVVDRKCRRGVITPFPVFLCSCEGEYGAKLTPGWSQHRTQNSVASVQCTNVSSRRPPQPSLPLASSPAGVGVKATPEWHFPGLSKKEGALFLSLRVSPSPEPLPRPHPSPLCAHTMPVALAVSPPPPYRPTVFKYRSIIRSWPSVSTRSPTWQCLR